MVDIESLCETDGHKFKVIVAETVPPNGAEPLFLTDEMSLKEMLKAYAAIKAAFFGLDFDVTVIRVITTTRIDKIDTTSFDKKIVKDLT